MRFGLLASLLTFLACGLVAGCKTAIIDGSGGSTSTTSTSDAATTHASASTGAPADCATLPCFDDDEIDGNDCLSCSQTTGPCKDEANTCSANDECGAFVACFTACPADDPMTPEVDEEFACLCTDDGTGHCDPASMPGTCVGDHPMGIKDYLSLVTCVLGDADAGESGACSAVCEQ